VAVPMLVNMKAFHTGYRAFIEGERVQVTFSPSQKLDVERRLKALRKGNSKLAHNVAYKLSEQGLYLIDIHRTEADALPEETIGEKVTIASNPYDAGSYASKEWERGFNAAYFRNLERLKRV
jgi:hypothetical protein